jgi:hypothetical protein
MADYVSYYLLDPSAMKLARRIDGLPLAFVMTETYLSRTSDSFSDYLQLYSSSWGDLCQPFCRGRGSTSFPWPTYFRCSHLVTTSATALASSI